MPAPQAAPSDVDPDADGLDVEIDPPHATPSLLSAHHSPVLAFLTALDPHAASDTLDVERVLHALTALDALYYSTLSSGPSSPRSSSHQDRPRPLRRRPRPAPPPPRPDPRHRPRPHRRRHRLLPSQPSTTNPAEHQRPRRPHLDIYEAREDWAGLSSKPSSAKPTSLDTPSDRADIWARMAIVASEILEQTHRRHLPLVPSHRGPRRQPRPPSKPSKPSTSKPPTGTSSSPSSSAKSPSSTPPTDALEAFRKLGRTCTSKRLRPLPRPALLEAGPRNERSRPRNPQRHQSPRRAPLRCKATWAPFKTSPPSSPPSSASASSPPTHQLAHYIQLAHYLHRPAHPSPITPSTVWEMVLDLDPAHPLKPSRTSSASTATPPSGTRPLSLLERKAALAAQAALPDSDENPDSASAAQTASTNLLLDAAAVWIRPSLNNPPRPTASCAAILELQQPLHDDAFSRLEALLSSTDNWQELITTYIERVGLY
jgi:hypothetical protein